VQPKIRVFINCINRLLGQSVGHILSKRPEFRLVSNFPSLIESSSEEPHSPVFIVDSLQSLSLERTQFSFESENSSGVRSLLIAMEDNRDQFLRAIRLRASGYVLQDASALDVVAAVRAVAQGEAVCPPRMTRLLFDYVARHAARHRAATPAGEKPLTRREQELVPLIGNGLTNKEIAAKLNLSEETIKSHIHRILRKVGVEDRRSAFEACQTSSLEV
jgi:DNA-binding NarL/FixJ family response regulator